MITFVDDALGVGVAGQVTSATQFSNEHRACSWSKASWVIHLAELEDVVHG